MHSCESIQAVTYPGDPVVKAAGKLIHAPA